MSYGYSARRTTLFLTIAACVLVLLGYGLFEGRKLIEGPQITIRDSINGSATSSAAVLISGLAAKHFLPDD